MIQHVRDGKISTVVVYKLDRLSRKQKDVLYLLEDVFDKHSVAFKSATEPFDTSTPLGKAMLGILAVFAQLERDTIVERTTSGSRQRVRRGLWRGGRVPFGYTYNDTTRALEVDPQQADLVKQIYKMYLRGKNLSELADWLADRTSDRAASHVTIRDMLDRPIYTGYQRLVTGEMYQAEHDPIISLEMWEQVQRERLRRRNDLTPKKSYLLTGLCRCGECGSSIVRIDMASRGYRYQYYACKNRHVRTRERRGAEYCKLPYQPQQTLEQYIVGQVKEAALNPDFVEQERARRRVDESNADLRLSLEQVLTDIDTKLDRWYEEFEAGASGLNSARIRDRVRALETERSQILTRLEELGETESRPMFEPLRESLDLVASAWDKMDFEERQAVLRLAIRQIVLRNDNDPEIVWNA